MKISKKWKRKLKSRILQTLSSIAIVTCTLATIKLAKFSMSLEKINQFMDTLGATTGEEIYNATDSTDELEDEVDRISLLSDAMDNNSEITQHSAERLENTDTITYIYDASDLATFRNNVNSGDSYVGKTVYVMADIDMSSVCSATVGTWEPIGAGNADRFAGTFDGNYHTIRNLYINSNIRSIEGLFHILPSSAIVQNVIIENVNILNTYNTVEAVAKIGGIAGQNNGTIRNCGIESGSIIGRKTSVNTTANTWPGPRVGGIVGYNYGTISGCYNKATIEAYSPTSKSYNELYVGGIAAANLKNLENCYNTGRVIGSAYGIYVGGIVGHTQLSSGTSGYFRNCYNYGSITAGSGTYKKIGGVAGRSGWSSTYYSMPITNCFTTNNVTYSYTYWNGSSLANSTAGKVAADTLKTYTVTLGSAFAYDVYHKNSGYPVLAWQNETPVMSLDKNQAYIKVNEKLPLQIVQDDEIGEFIQNNYAPSNFQWTSSNEDVATVDENGVVTGLTEGYTTVYAYQEEANLYAMAIVNVANGFANPQMGTGNGFTAILKADGTVWTLGNNENGQLGNGTHKNRNMPEKVHIDEDTELTNVIKIAVGTDHVLALTQEGKVYGWGLNSNGQLGSNNTTSSPYAKAVLGEDGASYLKDIVDISAGAYGSAAINKMGELYVWGKGSDGEIGNYAKDAKFLPTKNKLEKTIQVSVGARGNVSALTAEGVVWSWGYNEGGSHGINCSNSTSYPMKTALNVTEVSANTYHSVLKKVDGMVYGAGAPSRGRLGIVENDTKNITTYTKLNLPKTVTETNPVREFHAGRVSTTLLLKDGTIWETGANENGQLGNGTTTNSVGFVQGLIATNTPLEDILTVGKNIGDESHGNSLNTAVITKDGDVYATGDNSYGQIGDGTTTNSTYYKKIGFVQLTYEDKTIYVDQAGSQIELSKLKYVGNESVNVYEEKTKSLGEMKYTSLNETMVTVDEKGKITAKEGMTGSTKIKIEDITNGYETYVTVIANRLKDTDEILYIYDANDLASFRDKVNAGNSYQGKTVYVMADIDMSSVCSETVGTWEPIGFGNTDRFAGTFDGNYHTISNLYINNNRRAYEGLFYILPSTGTIQNIILRNVSILNTYNEVKSTTYTGSITAYNYGTILNCGIESGDIVGRKTSVNTTANSWPGPRVGGIVGHNYGTISGCYNKGTVESYAPTSNSYNEIYAGGIVAGNYKNIENCYNTGRVTGSASGIYVGGIAGHIQLSSGTSGYFRNCYNYGSITAGSGTYKKIGGVAGRSGWNSTYYSMPITNCFTTNNVTYSYYYWDGSTQNATSTEGKTEAEILKTYASKLGVAFEADDFEINNGYPILWWEAPTIELNQKQSYIKKGENLQLNIIQNDQTTRIFGDTISIDDFTWSSRNEEVAMVNEKATVTGIAEGYTTIYGKHKTENISTMCVIYVAKDVATPQVETGQEFTAILKADGTVWTLGNNRVGQLGDGTNEGRATAVQVKIDKNTYLNNIVKISAGSNHVLALTKEGKVYAWGDNTNLQLGREDMDSCYYAKLVLEGDSNNPLHKMIDISAGSFGSMAINQFGWVYVWGNGSYGELANAKTNHTAIPTKTAIPLGISASMGAGHATVIGQNAKVYAWGRNLSGELGTANTTNYSTIAKVADQITQISSAGYETIVQKADGSVYATGLNTSGQLATGTTTNVTKFTPVNLPANSIENQQVKYIKAGTTSTTLMLKDGSVYTAGNNTKGELGNKTNTNASSFVQAQTEEGMLENIGMIGRSSGIQTSLNIATIHEAGRVYLSGSNSAKQLGSNASNDMNYFIPLGNIEMQYPETIPLHVGETLTLQEDDLKYLANYFNVYQEDKQEKSLIEHANMIDANLATYEKGVITGKNIGSTMLVVNEPSTQALVYIPVSVLPENAMVVPDTKTGNDFTIALKANGTVWSFGTNQSGELGIGTSDNQKFPMQVEALKDEVVTTISVGDNHVLALTQKGEVYSWGRNKNSQLGVNDTQNRNQPEKVTFPESTTQSVSPVKDTIIKVIANKNVSYAITQSGAVYAWGDGFGSSPKLLAKDYHMIDVSKTYALDMDRNVYELATDRRLTIVEKIKSISEGNSHTIFLGENATAYAIGSNTYGQFGDGTKVSNESEVIAVRNEDQSDLLRNITKIEAGNGYTTALLSDATLLQWGLNNHTQLGTNQVESTVSATENIAVQKLLTETKQNIMLMDAGKDHVAITLSNGNVYTWGSGDCGELGNSLTEDQVNPQLVGKNNIQTNTNHLLLSVNDIFDISSSTTYFNLLKEEDSQISYESEDETVVTVDPNTGKVQAKKQGTTVIVAKEVNTGIIAVIQVRVLPEGVHIEPQVQTNGNHTVTLKVDGTVWCYGDNTNGELGNGINTYSDEPVQAIFPEGTSIVQIVAGENFSAALDKEGYVWTWGANDYGQLGNPSSATVNIPTKVSGLSHITKITAGTYHMLALAQNKQVYAWGLNTNGELGIGNDTNKVTTPILSKNLGDIIDMTAGRNHSLVLKSTGEVLATGLNQYGQLGNSDTSVRKVNQFTKVPNLTEVARITATDAGNIVSTVKGEVYSWGSNIYGELGLGDKTNRQEPTHVENIQNIVQVSGGKNHSILLDQSGKVWLAGSNQYGQLGNGTKVENISYQAVDSLQEVMTVSAGNTYTVVAKEDGTVWGFGDYYHGGTTYKSKTNSSVPIQVGNDAFGLGMIKITVPKSKTVNITASFAYRFNLIHTNQNGVEGMTYRSLNESIATVNGRGDVLGVKEGFTWIKATQEDGTSHVVYVYVTDPTLGYAPVASAGEDFASVLKADGSIWTFGHNNYGELGIDSNKTKDVPEKTNCNTSFKEMKSGNSFTLAIENDGTLWSFGKNNYGQLGIGNTENGLNPVKINTIADVTQIATGKEHSVALDKYGILYGWGRNDKGQLGLEKQTVLTPTPIAYTSGTISSIWAGENETIIVNTKGEVYGQGSLLKGKLEGLTNAVKVSVGKGYLLILTTQGEVYQYDGSQLRKYTQLEDIVDIDVKNDKNMAQTVDEKVYTFTGNTSPKLAEMKNVYTIASGVHNEYVILTDGSVYARGQNNYGQLGNGTRQDCLTEFTLVGSRKFKVEPESKTMYVNDVETLTEQMLSNEFNVFNRSIKNPEEYTWESSDESIVSVENGKLTAKQEGTAEITITDPLTQEKIMITRVVIPIEKDRIETIKVNNTEATMRAEYSYYVEVATNSKVGTLFIQTKDKTDKITIDNATTWYENGSLTATINLPEEENEIPIMVETENGTQIPYTLLVKKVGNDVSLESVTVDGVKATATSRTNYEMVVPEETDIAQIVATANSDKAQVSVNGESYQVKVATAEVTYQDSTPVVIPILVKSENGDEFSYHLTIYKASTALELESLTVNSKEAIKTSEGIYSITIPRDTKKAEITAKAVSELVNVSIDHENSEVQIATKTIDISEEITQVQIRLSTTINEKEVYRDYVLNIYKKVESGKIQFVMVNGTVVLPQLNGTYEVYLPSETTSATVTVIAQNEEDYVQIGSHPEEKTKSIVTVVTPEDHNEYAIKVIDSETKEAEAYQLFIKKPSVDATLKEIAVSNGKDRVIASKSIEEENVYIAYVKSYDDYTVTAITNHINAYVGIEEHPLIQNVDTKVVHRTDDITEVSIQVKSESGDLETYRLKIKVMSSDTSLDFIKVNDQVATLQEDGTYLINLATAETQVSVTAQTRNEEANVKIENSTYEKHVTTKGVTIYAKDTQTDIYVQAQDGTVQKHKLVISGLPDNTELKQVLVNEIEAKYNIEQNKYEVRMEDIETFHIEAIANDSLASVSLNGETANIGKSTISIQKAGEVTIVKIKVIAQDGIDTAEYILEIQEKSKDTTIANVMVDKKMATKLPDGNYVAEVSSSVNPVSITVEANDDYATVYLEEETQNANHITVTKEILEQQTVYTIKVVAEDGTEEEHTLTITRLESNTKIKELSVITTTQTEEETGEITTKEDTQIVTPLEDGSYYLRIDRVENVDVKAILEDSTASVQIYKATYMLAQDQVNVPTIAEITTVMIHVKAEDGTIQDYVLKLEKKSNDTKLKTITSPSMLKREEYTITVEESEDTIDLTLVTNDPKASIKLAEEETYTPSQITKTIDLSEALKAEDSDLDGWIVNVNVQAEDGTVENYRIAIIKTGNVNIEEVKVEEEVIGNINNTYTARVAISDTAHVQITPQDSKAKVEIIQVTQENDENIETVVASAVGVLDTDVDLMDDPQNYVIRVTSTQGTVSKDYDLILIQKSTEVGLSYVKVDHVTAIYTTDGYQSTVSGKETYPVLIKATDEKAKIKIAYQDYEGEYVTGILTQDVPVKEGETLEVTITVQGENGNEKVEKLFITRMSDNTKLEYVKVNDTEVENVENVYTYEMAQDNYLAHVEIASIQNETIRVDNNQGMGQLEFDVVFDEDTIQVEKTIQLTSADGTVKKEYQLVIRKKTQIKGKVKTVNFEDKHISTISLYKEGEEKAREEVTTKEDGTYVIDVKEVGIYQIIVNKQGYLNYTVTNLEVIPGRIIELNEYKLIAGDTVISGQIEIDDLVTLNDNMGITILDENKEEKSIYDLNEDGEIDDSDRNILKSNYGKKAITEEWVNPNPVALMTETVKTKTKTRRREEGAEEEEDEEEENYEDTGKTAISINSAFMLPIKCNYRITSEYGTRTHPVTGEVKRHTGIDLGGEHRTEIYAVAEGEVVFAGVQNGFGNCIEIKHIVDGEIIYSFYAHLSRIDVIVGQEVKQGEVIGLEGGDPATDPNPGSSTGHHLHFELRSASGYGNDVDPRDYMEF